MLHLTKLTVLLMEKPSHVQIYHVSKILFHSCVVVSLTIHLLKTGSKQGLCILICNSFSSPPSSLLFLPYHLLKKQIIFHVEFPYSGSGWLHISLSHVFHKLVVRPQDFYFMLAGPIYVHSYRIRSHIISGHPTSFHIKVDYSKLSCY